MAHACHSSYAGSINRITLQVSWAKKQDPIWKIRKTKTDGSVAQGVEHLPSKCELLS
jgi:hypothetical protein